MVKQWSIGVDNNKLADQNSPADEEISGGRGSGFQEIVDDKEGEEEGEQRWRLA